MEGRGRMRRKIEIYLVKIGTPNPYGGWGLDVGWFETVILEDAKEVAEFFKKKGFLTCIFKMERLEETDDHGKIKELSSSMKTQ
jgi:hypothetical protein